MLQAAESFLLSNARLLERQRFAYHFKNGSKAAVIRALQAYQNDDGGFGHALEPDKRTASSQPIDQEIALRILDATLFDTELVEDICSYLLTITTHEGAVPFTLVSVNDAPHAPWWATQEASPQSSINPTASLTGLLHKHGVTHPWLQNATRYCWQHIEHKTPAGAHDLLCILLFLEHVPERERAIAAFESLKPIILQHSCLELDAKGYVHPPYAFAPSPESLAYPLYDARLFHQHLRHLQASQQEDGGWAIKHPPISPGCELEYRGIVTLDNLLLLQANGYL